MSWLCFIHGLIGVRVNSGFIEFNGRFGVLKGLPDCTILHSGSSHFHRMSEPVCRQCEVIFTDFEVTSQSKKSQELKDHLYILKGLRRGFVSRFFFPRMLPKTFLQCFAL